MDKEIAKGSLGSNGDYDIEFKAGNLVATAKGGVGGLKVGVVVELDSDIVLDAIAKAIPGTIDDAVIGLIKSTLKA